jgi:hypothetical protein
MLLGNAFANVPTEMFGVQQRTVFPTRSMPRYYNREWLFWRGPAAIVNDRPILSSERMLHKDHNGKCSFGKKNAGHKSQEVCRQDDLIAGKPPVVKKLLLWLWVSQLRVSCTGVSEEKTWSVQLENLYC